MRRAFLMVCVVVHAGLAMAADPLPAAARAVAAVIARGGTVEYDSAGHVVKVDLADRPSTDADIELLAGLAELRSLEVWGVEITDGGIAALARCGSLESLVLENTTITDAGVPALAGLRGLKVLNLRRSSNLPDDALEAVAKLPSLEQLVLLYNNFTDAGLAHLAPLTKPAELDLWDTRVGDAGMETVGRLKTLVKLNLQNTRVTDAGIAQLADLVALKTLDLTGTKVTDAVLATLGRMGAACGPCRPALRGSLTRPSRHFKRRTPPLRSHGDVAPAVRSCGLCGPFDARFGER